MTAAVDAVQKAVQRVPSEVSARFDTATKLSDADSKLVVDAARAALVSFQAPVKK